MPVLRRTAKAEEDLIEIMILYREIDDGIEVVRVVHGSRYLPDILS